MKNFNFLIALSLSLLVLSCSGNKKGGNKAKDVSNVSTVSDIPEYSIDQVKEKVNNLVGKEIKITGTVGHICKHSGRRVLLLSPSGKKLRIEFSEVQDSSIAGASVVVDGILKEKKYNKEVIKTWISRLEKAKKDKQDKSEYDEKIEEYKAMLDKIESGAIPYVSSLYVNGKSIKKIK